MHQSIKRNSKALTPPSEHHLLASSCLHPPLDLRRKKRCFLFAGFPTSATTFTCKQTTTLKITGK